MDFSSADVPISRETWAPRSPDRSSSSAPVGSMPPTAPSDARAPQHPTNNDSDYDRSGRSPRAVSRDYDDRRGREDRYSNGNGSGHAPYVPPYRQNDDRERPRDSAEPRRAAPTTAEANPVIGVFGLSVRTKERDLEDEFGKYGDVEKVVIVYDQRTDRSRGFGFITMRKTEHAAEAIKHLNGYNLHGRNIRVDYSATPKAHNPTPGQYMGEKKPIYGVDDRYRGRYGGDNRRFDDRRGYDRGDRYDRYDDRRDRDRDAYRPPRDYSDPYGGRSRREDDRRRSPRRGYSPERRPVRDYDAPPRDSDIKPRY